MGQPKRNPRNGNGHRRRKLRAQVLAEEDQCWLCGRYVDKDLPAGHPRSAEVDEVVPVSRGGSPYDRANCRLACRICNQRRGNGMRGQRRPVATFITTCTRDAEELGAGAPSCGYRPATHGHSATDAASESTGKL